MYLRPYTELPSRCAWAVARWWYGVRVFWYTLDKEPWAFVLIVGLIITLFGFALQAHFARQDDRRNLVCLARNVYYEARGEPAAGQYAVAEVTMNRKASGRFSATVCGVVYQKNWDPLRKRYVGAFSWTEFSVLPAPVGEEWQLAWRVAEAVYYRREAPCSTTRPISNPTGREANDRLPGLAAMCFTSRTAAAARLNHCSLLAPERATISS
jgi:N-acetylmuramoyl-L-alanine amidase